MNTPAPPRPRQVCDVIMKGGITSGVVYPKLLAKLHEKYDFASIGGTSAGAIAAALAAAAQFGEHRKDDSIPPESQGFAKFTKVCEALAQPGGLQRLFSPTRKARFLFKFFFDAVGKGLGHAIATYWWPWIVFSVVASIFIKMGFYVIFPEPKQTFPLDAILIGVSFGFLLMPVWMIFVLLNRIPKDGFGLCTGRNDNLPFDKSDPNVLFDWLDENIQLCGGLSPQGDPLTFGDLCARNNGKNTQQRLQMFTTNLTLSMPVVIPDDDIRYFVFRTMESKRFFGSRMTNFLIAHSSKPKSAPTLPEGYFYLPKGADFPVAIATRMSLSFPILFCAVPAYTIPAEKAGLGSIEEAGLQKNWFSDGGICSNFPIHSFDTWLPSHPTFAVNLTGRSIRAGTSGAPSSTPTSGAASSTDGAAAVSTAAALLEKNSAQAFCHLRREASPTSNNSKTSAVETPPEANTNANNEEARSGSALHAKQASYRLYQADQEVSPVYKSIGDMASFLFSIINTAKDCHDSVQSALPGFRERIVHVELENNEGGLNLAMPKDVVDKIMEKGREAGQALVDDFNFETHRWGRLRILLHVLEDQLRRFNMSLIDITPDGISQTTWDKLRRDKPFPISDEEWPKLSRKLAALASLTDSWNIQVYPPPFASNEILPAPTLRVTPLNM